MSLGIGAAWLMLRNLFPLANFGKSVLSPCDMGALDPASASFYLDASYWSMD